LAPFTFLATSFDLWTPDNPGRRRGEQAPRRATSPAGAGPTLASGPRVRRFQEGAFASPCLVETIGLNFGLKLGYLRLDRATLGCRVLPGTPPLTCSVLCRSSLRYPLLPALWRGLSPLPLPARLVAEWAGSVVRVTARAADVGAPLHHVCTTSEGPRGSTKVTKGEGEKLVELARCPNAEVTGLAVSGQDNARVRAVSVGDVGAPAMSFALSELEAAARHPPPGGGHRLFLNSSSRGACSYLHRGKGDDRPAEHDLARQA
jgi:hypothetical protein